jgi:phosphate transport system permease protein
MGLSAIEISETSVRPVSGRGLQRRLFDYLGWGLCALAFLFLGGAMMWILAVVFMRGVSALNFSVITHVTVGTGGGLLNAIEGTLVLALGGISLAAPPGLAAGIYLAEFDRGRLAPTIRFLADVLVGVPSIVIGYFGYVTMVVALGWKFSVAAGSVALAIISLPYICRTTEMALRQVPRALREAAYALGAGDGRVTLGICVPAALPGILTGILLALAISVGETAPLIYTAGWSSYLWTGHLTNEPIGYLTYVIWSFISEPFESAHVLAYAAAFFVTLFVLVISILTRMVLDENAGWRRLRPWERRKG